jgi:phosphomannomutase
VEKKGRIISYNIREDYLKFVSKWKKPLKGLKIVFDSSNGMEGLYLKEVFKDCGAECTYINLDVDGTFPAHEANPLVEENILQLRAKVLELKADVGVIFDGDADRVAFLDETGAFVYPEILKHEKTAVSCDIRSSRSTIEEIELHGGTPLICRVGHVFAKALIREHDAALGGELAGHYYFRENSYCDSGLIACLLMLGIIAESGKPVSELVRGITKYHYSGEINFKLENKDELIEIVKAHFPGGELNDLDGIRVDFADWWYNLRKSNTEPYLRLVCEATTAEMLQEKVSEITKLVEKHRKG